MSIIHWPLDKWIDNVALGALSSKESLKATFDLADNAIVRGIPGDFVECGVFGGSQCAVMARALMDSHGHIVNGRDYGGRRVHLFDSFAGVPAPTPEDVEWIDAGHKTGQSVCTLEGVKAHMAEWGIPDELLVYHVGLFSETVRYAPANMNEFADAPDYNERIENIAVLRLDGDLYQSTRVCLEHLYPLVSPGGWIIVDDFNLSGARKAFLDYDGGRCGPGYFQKQP